MMEKRIFGLGVVGVSLLATQAFAWNATYECVSNNAKKSKVAVSFLDAEVLKTHEEGSTTDRYYRVTDTSEELVEAIILGHKSGETAHLVPVLKGTMNVTMTQLTPGSVTASVKVGKAVTTYSCK